MKKLCSILITLTLLIACFSCSSNEENISNTQTNNESQTTIVEDNKQEENEVEQDTPNDEVIENTEDKQEKPEEVKVLDNGANPNYNYWVTFYDHDGNIIQQEAIKYGTVPTYWSDTPYYDDGTNWYKGVGWTDAYGRDVTEFQPIKGNTKFYAKYEVGGAVSHSSSSSSSDSPAPAPSCALSSQYLLHINSISGSDVFCDEYIWDTTQSKYLLRVANTNKQFTDSSFSPTLSSEEWIHTEDITGTITYEDCDNNGSHDAISYSLCSSHDPIIKITYKESYAPGPYFRWIFYEYNETTSRYEKNTSLSKESGNGIIPGVSVGNYYHVSNVTNFNTWWNDDGIRGSAIYTQCTEASLDHIFHE